MVSLFQDPFGNKYIKEAQDAFYELWGRRPSLAEVKQFLQTQKAGADRAIQNFVSGVEDKVTNLKPTAKGQETLKNILQPKTSTTNPVIEPTDGTQLKLNLQQPKVSNVTGPDVNKVIYSGQQAGKTGGLLDEIASTTAKNWGFLNKGPNFISRAINNPFTRFLGKWAPVAGVPFEVAGGFQNNAMADQMDSEMGAFSNPYLFSDEMIADRTGRNKAKAISGGVGAALGIPFGPFGMLAGAGIGMGADTLGQLIADKYSKKRSVVKGVDTNSPLYLTPEQTLRVMGKGAESRGFGPNGLQEISEEEFYSDPSTFPFKDSYIPQSSNQVRVNYQPLVDLGILTPQQASNYSQPQQSTMGYDGINPIVLQGEVEDGGNQPELRPKAEYTLEDLRNMMDPNMKAMMENLQSSPLMDPNKLMELIQKDNKQKRRSEVMTNALRGPKFYSLGGAPMRYWDRQYSTPQSELDIYTKQFDTMAKAAQLQQSMQKAGLSDAATLSMLNSGLPAWAALNPSGASSYMAKLAEQSFYPTKKMYDVQAQQILNQDVFNKMVYQQDQMNQRNLLNQQYNMASKIMSLNLQADIANAMNNERRLTREQNYKLQTQANSLREMGVINSSIRNALTAAGDTMMNADPGTPEYNNAANTIMQLTGYINQMITPYLQTMGIDVTGGNMGQMVNPYAALYNNLLEDDEDF